MPDWYQDAKLGIFIHWGLPSVPAFAAGDAFKSGELEGAIFDRDPNFELPYSEWYLYSLQNSEGRTRAFHDREFGSEYPYWNFQPVFQERVKAGWKPQRWASLFEQVGAKYVVLVSKHHDGYSLWPSRVSNPHRDNWQSPQDLVGELADAVRQRDMKYGLYYSTGLDWTFQLASDGDSFADFLRSAPLDQDYGDYVYDHLTEIIDQYQPDVLWADIGYPSKGRLDQILSYYFDKVPNGVVNDRWEAFDFLGRIANYPGGAWVLKHFAKWSLSQESDPLLDQPQRYGFKTEEYAELAGIPSFKWESTRGLGGSFGFNRNEVAADMLTGPQLIHYLVDVVSKNGNLLINVGPDSHGTIPEIQQTPLRELGNWMQIHGEAIYGTRPWIRYGDTSAEGLEIRYTYKDKQLYATVLGQVNDTLTLPSPLPDVHEVELMGHGPVTYQLSVDGLHIQLDNKPLAPQAAYTFILQLK